jgi:hypothetical protein
MIPTVADGLAIVKPPAIDQVYNKINLRLSARTVRAAFVTLILELLEPFLSSRKASNLKQHFIPFVEYRSEFTHIRAVLYISAKCVGLLPAHSPTTTAEIY